MKKIMLLGLFLGVILSQSLLGATNVHLHGQAQLNLVVDEEHISMALSAPAMTLIGFEHEPRTDEEKNAIKTVTQTLNELHLFAFYEKKRFLRKPRLLQLQRLYSNAELHHDNHQKDTHTQTNENIQHSHSPHIEFKLNVRYKQDPGNNVALISTELFNHFKDLHNIVVTIFSNDIQTQQVLSPNHAKVRI